MKEKKLTKVGDKKAVSKGKKFEANPIFLFFAGRLVSHRLPIFLPSLSTRDYVVLWLESVTMPYGLLFLLSIRDKQY